MKVLVSLLIAAACLLAIPAVASAVTYTVDSTADEADLLPGTGGCLTAGGKCTLRAAIEESNFSAGTRDEIKLASNPFDGQPGATIALGSALPAIKDPVSVLGGDCFGEDGPDRPCAGVEGPAGASAFTVEDASEVVIEGLAITGARTAIRVIGGSEGFAARLDWIGVTLDGSADGNTTGIFLGPSSNGATIGGADASKRNVIAGNGVDGLDIDGADDALVEGNYFGVAPGGATAEPNSKDIEVTDSTAAGGSAAEGNEIGTAAEGAALATAACDGGCNVISGATSVGLDLSGNGAGQEEAPASGPTFVSGNYVGLDAGGTSVVANATWGVLAVGADNLEIGGALAGDANFIDGGLYGVYTEKGEGFEARGNLIGFDASGEPVTPPSVLGFLVVSLGVSEGATIAENAIRMVGGVALEHEDTGATISANLIEGGQYGIKTLGAGAPAGSEIEANEIVGAGLDGILIENEGNLLVGNAIEGSGQAGIRIQENGLVPAPGNLIGGDEAAGENVIAGNGGDAIEVVGDENSDEQIERNRGGGNGGLFIDLGGDGEGNEPTGPN